MFLVKVLKTSPKLEYYNPELCRVKDRMLKTCVILELMEENLLFAHE